MRRVPVRLIRESRSPPRSERPIYTELEKIREEALNERRIHADRLVCGQIARELARNPDTMERNDKATDDILDDIIERWERGYFADDELQVQPLGQTDSLSLKSALELARQTTFPREIWRDGIMMTLEAARRYIRLIASKDNAERVLKRLALTEEPRSPPGEAPVELTSSPHKAPSDVRGKKLQLFVDTWAEARFQAKPGATDNLPDRERLLELARNEVGTKVTEPHIRELLSKYASPDARKGGAKFHGKAGKT
jgi:hypothetical protein